MTLLNSDRARHLAASSRWNCFGFGKRDRWALLYSLRCPGGTIAARAIRRPNQFIQAHSPR